MTTPAAGEGEVAATVPTTDREPAPGGAGSRGIRPGGVASGRIESVNVGVATSLRTRAGSSGINKVPVAGPVRISRPGPNGSGESGVAGDYIHSARHHGGEDQAVYAYALEDLQWWEGELDREIRAGFFGENLTTSGLDLSGALLGERWRIGSDVVLQVTKPRIPCNTFATWMSERGWIATFTERRAPGAYLKVLPRRGCPGRRGARRAPAHPRRHDRAHVPGAHHRR